MHSLAARYIPLVAFLCLFAARAEAQDATFEAFVRDSETGEAVQNATVELTGASPLVLTTDADGRAEIGLQPGPYRYAVHAAGYASIEHAFTVRAGERFVADVALQRISGTQIDVVSGYFYSGSPNFNLFDTNYFITGFQRGHDHDDVSSFEYSNQVKFRIAVRYRVMNLRPSRWKNTGLHATYTQNSWWHIFESSTPFFDNNYGPGAFLQLDTHDIPNTMSRLGIPGRLVRSVYAGIVHESNGRSETFSRGWNRFIFGVSLGSEKQNALAANITFWKPFHVDTVNTDLPDYAGRGEVKLFFQPFLKPGRDFGLVSLEARARILGKQPVTNLELNLLVHITERFGRVFTPSLMVQLFTGYAEDLQTYSQPRTGVRIGFAAIR